jgi:hypothetical protein
MDTQSSSATQLFKFVGSKSAVLNMARGSLKFTPIDALNDPSELTPVMDRAAVLSSLELLRTNGLTQNQYDWLVRQGATLDLLAPEEKVLNAPKTLTEANRIFSFAVYEDLDYMERKLFSTITSVPARAGILSLSERYNSLPMWAHYGKSGRERDRDLASVAITPTIPVLRLDCGATT